MERTFTTTDEQDAAIAWRIEQLKAQGVKVTEAQLIAQFATKALTDLVAAFSDDEASKVFTAFKDASLGDRVAAKKALNL